MLPTAPVSPSNTMNMFSAVISTAGSSGVGKSFIKLTLTMRASMQFCNLSRHKLNMFLVELKPGHVRRSRGENTVVPDGAGDALSILKREVPGDRVLLIDSSEYGAFPRCLERELKDDVDFINPAAINQSHRRFSIAMRRNPRAVTGIPLRVGPPGRHHPAEATA